MGDRYYLYCVPTTISPLMGSFTSPSRKTWKKDVDMYTLMLMIKWNKYPPSLWRCEWSPSWPAAPAWWSPPGPPSCSSSGCPQPRSPGSSWSRRTGSGRRRNMEPKNWTFTQYFFTFMIKTYLNLNCLGQCWGYNLAKQDCVLQNCCRSCDLQNTRGIRHSLISQIYWHKVLTKYYFVIFLWNYK